MAGEVKEAKKAVEEQVAEAKPAEAKPAEAKPAEANPLVEAVHKVLLAGIGAMALAKEDMEDLVGKLVERGEIAEKDGKSLMHEVMEKRKKIRGEVKEKTSQRVRQVLDHLEVPSRKELNDLSEKIAALTKKIEELKHD